MHSAIFVLALGLAVAVASGSLADHAALIAGRNLGAERAERAAAAFVRSCGREGCDHRLVNVTRIDSTVLTGCVRQTEGGAVLQVDARVPWNPRVLVGLTPAHSRVAVDLGGFSVPVAKVLHPCL
ncbi:MAG: hypothetical protein OXF04_06235 [bacterium]|nr:hypothetical protein [bacterium]